MTYRPTKRPLLGWLAGCLIGCCPALINGAAAQSSQSMLFIGGNPGVGIGVYNSVGVTGGFDLRYQHPLKGNLVLILKTGGETLRIKGRYANQFINEYQTATGFSLPFAVGPRYYFMKGMYTGLNLGVDIGLTRIVTSSFRFEPGVGVVVPLRAGGYVDAGTSVSTSFSQGSGTFSFNVAYGLPWGRSR